MKNFFNFRILIPKFRFLLSDSFGVEQNSSILVKMMKRYSSRPNSVDEQAKALSKYQILLEDFVELQKVLVSMKSRLQKKKQDRETLLAEVRFLRERHEFLTMLESQKHKFEQDSVQQQSLMLPKDGATQKKKKPKKPLRPDLNSNMVEESGDMVHEKDAMTAGKKRKGSLISSKREKKKISWQDPVALKV